MVNSAEARRGLYSRLLELYEEAERIMPDDDEALNAVGQGLDMLRSVMVGDEPDDDEDTADDAG